MAISIYKKFAPEGSFDYFKDTKVVIFSPENARVIDLAEDGKGAIDLTSEKTKFFINFSGSPYHFFYDSLGHFLIAYENNKDAQFIFNFEVLEKNADKNFLFFIKKFLNDLNINLIETSSLSSNYVKINNFYINAIQHPPIPEPTKLISSYLKKYVKDDDIEPYRKIYISRNKSAVGEVEYLNLNHNNLSFAHPRKRIDDESKIEDFFKSKGFQIVYAEDFNSVEDQINFMHSVKTMACITGSSFLNLLFMRPGTSYIEIVTPMTTVDSNGVYDRGPWIESLHHFGTNLTFHMDQNAHLVNNNNFKADDVLNKIKNNIGLMAVIDE